MTGETRRGPEPPDISEKGGMKAGQPQRSDTRLFMQLLAFGGCADSPALAESLARIDPSSGTALTTLGWVYYRNGRPDDRQQHYSADRELLQHRRPPNETWIR